MRKHLLKELGWTLALLGLGACADATPTSPRLTGSDVGPRLAAGSNVAGANFTTNNPAVDGSGTCANGPDRSSPSVNCNHYGSKRFVWVNGGPTNGANALTPGTYFFAVLAPSGQSSPNDGDDDNLSDDYDSYLNRRFTVGPDGKIATYIPDGIAGTPNHDVYNLASPAQLMLRAYPYANTPNPGGVYIMALCRIDVGGYPVDPKQCKYDEFKVVEERTITKTVHSVMMEDLQGNMFVDPTAVIAPDGLSATITIPKTGIYATSTRWIEYTINVWPAPTSVDPVVVVDDILGACATGGAGFTCSAWSPGNPPSGNVSWTSVATLPLPNLVTGNTAEITLDVTNVGACGIRTITNTASIQGTLIVSKPVVVTVNSGACQ